ncbi:MAG: hypothetical protein HYT87_17160 [Nitrospirae bacterium]|nr:hypothetical protein [Nitrospirota bacterium]
MTPAKRQTLLPQLLALLGGTSYVVLVLWGSPIRGLSMGRQHLRHDHVWLYSFFYDHLHSVNHFGEIAWWHPNIQYGFPLFFPSILGTNTTTPLFAAFTLVAWLLGRLGVHLSSFFVPYLLYHALLVPLLFGLGLLLLVRRLLRERALILFVIMAGCACPAVVFQNSDVGFLEQTGYGFLYAAAFLRFLKNPGPRTFWPAVVCCLVLGVSTNLMFFCWNVLFVPIWTFLSMMWRPGGMGGQVRKLVRSVPIVHGCAALLMAGICILPGLVTLIDGEGILRSRMGAETYNYTDLFPGNPLEILSAGVPGAGFEWSDNHEWELAPMHKEGAHRGYHYVGSLVLALAFFCLVLGRPFWRQRLLLFVAAFSMIVLLSAHSPVFSLLLSWLGPLKRINHYSDVVFRAGFSAILTLMAGMGLEGILRSSQRWRWVFLGVFVLTATGSMLLFGVIYRNEIYSNWLFGFELVAIMLELAVVVWLALARGRVQVRRSVHFLAFLVLLDNSTVAFWYIRSIGLPHRAEIIEPSLESIGITGQPSFHANTLLYLKNVKALQAAGINPESLPKLGLAEMGGEEGKRNGSEVNPGMPLQGSAIRSNQGPAIPDNAPVAIRPLLAGEEIAILGQTYNRIQLSVSAAEPSQLFWRDAYFAGWSATVNGRAESITKPFGAFKAVPVPRGRSSVEFRFSPPGSVGLALLAAYACIVGALLLCVWVPRRHR